MSFGFMSIGRLDRAGLDARGWAVVDADAILLSASPRAALGRVIQRTAIRILPNPPTVLQSCHRMAFHIDTPCADYVCWTCDHEGLPGEGSLIVPIGPALDALDPATWEASESIHLSLPPGYPAGESLLSAYEATPLAFERRGLRGLNFAPWLVPALDNPDKRRAYEAVLGVVAAAARQPLEIELTRDRALVIRNSRVLHSRTELAVHSPRSLIRNWIACPADAAP
jgi:hypothetical protein